MQARPKKYKMRVLFIFLRYFLYKLILYLGNTKYNKRNALIIYEV